jgi:hypothetical protein
LGGDEMIEHIDWEQLKTLQVSFNTPFKHIVDNSGNTIVFIIEAGVTYRSELTSSDLEEFNTNFLSQSNQPNDKKDPYTGKIVTKDEPYNGALYIPCLRFTTGQIEDFNGGGDSSWIIDISTPGKTMITYAPNFSYQIDGCGFKLRQARPTNDLIFSKVSVAIDTPHEHTFVRNWGIDKDYEFYERVTSPKYIKYYSSIPGLPDSVSQAFNNITFEVLHDPNDFIKLQLWVSIYLVEETA